MQDKSQFETFLQWQSYESQAMRDIRKDAFNNFLKIGYPTKKHENWRFTNLTSLAKFEYRFPNGEMCKIDVDIVSKHSIDNSHRIVLINGIFDSKLSEIDDIAKRITIKNISESSSDLNQSSAKNNTNPFILLNKAFVKGGYYIEIDSNYIEDKPLHILNIISGEKDFVQHHHQNFIRLGKNSQVIIVEENININHKASFRNTVYNIKVDENSTLSHILLQQNHAKSKELNHIFVEQQDNSTYNTQLINISGDLIRNDLNVQIDGENCDTDISGLSLLSGKDHVDNYTVVSHNKPNSNSRQLFKYILDESSEGVFNGLVTVQPDAQKTDSRQTNKNILLSKKALMNSNPQLEIYADDVKCSHGSATGELDEDAIFYLRSRGIDLMIAKSLLLEGFAKEVTDKIKIDSVKEKLNSEILKRLTG
ncbi:Fe-S cluster assembly protein SufD [bacterium]|nr:Fe-S cluster assembly protein SufD [bacterium]